MRPKLAKRLGILALVPMAALSVASLLSLRSALLVNMTSWSFSGVDTSFLHSNRSDESATGRNSSSTVDASPRPRDESFSACLLVMDDNFRLPEWIAYHYYALNLRYMVVAVDPRSKTSPSPLLDRWKDRIHVEIWTNDTFVTTRNCTKNISHSKNLILKKDSHRCRQIEFYQSCSRHLKRSNRTWTSFHDVDEFLVVPSSVRANLSHFVLAPQQPGYILQLIQQYTSYRDKSHPGISIVRDETNWPYWFSQPCFTVPRVLFSAAELETNPYQNRQSTSIPRFVDFSRFDTLRFRYQATPKGDSDGLAKSLMDVSRMPIDLSTPDAMRGQDTAAPPGNAHRPYRHGCTHAWPKSGALPLVIHHYLGSWEAFSFRDDARRGGLRTIEKWRERSNVRLGGVNDDACDWIRGFIRMVGEEAAQELLEGAGLPADYKMPENETVLWLAQT